MKKLLLLCVSILIIASCAHAQNKKPITKKVVKKATRLLVQGNYEESNSEWEETKTADGRTLKPKFHFCKILVRRYTAFKTDRPPFTNPSTSASAITNVNYAKDLILEYQKLEERDTVWLQKKFGIDYKYLMRWKITADSALVAHEKYIDSLVLKIETVPGNDSLIDIVKGWDPGKNPIPAKPASDSEVPKSPGPIDMGPENVEVERDGISPVSPIPVGPKDEKRAQEEIAYWQDKVKNFLAENQGQTVGIAIRSDGRYGENLVIEMSYYFNKERDSFGLGQYKHDKMDELCLSFYAMFNDQRKGKKKTMVVVSGYADANPVSGNLKYLGDLGGKVSLDLDGKHFNVSPGQVISNYELAGLRLTHGIQSLEKVSKGKLHVDQTNVYDYQGEGDNYKGPQHRRVVFEVFIYNYFLTDLEIDEIRKCGKNVWVNQLNIEGSNLDSSK